MRAMHWATLGLLALSSCAAPLATRPPTASRTALKVVLYPYLPEQGADGFRSLRDSLETRFERREPGIDLHLRLRPNDPLYHLDSLAAFLGPDSAGWDVVEVDAVLLGDLVRRDLIEAWPDLSPNDWHPAARAASMVRQRTFGVPHWLCSYFLYTRDPRVSAARSARGLAAALTATDSRVRPWLVADFRGSWTTAGLYLNAWAATHGPRQVAQAVSSAPDSTALRALLDILHTCAVSEGNPCLDSTYDDNDVAPRRFARGEAVAFVGYSERLHALVREGGTQDLLISAAPLGTGGPPLLYADVLTLRKGSSRATRRAAARFAAFLNDPATVEFVVMTRDVPGSPPRYLLPASMRAYAHASLRGDRYYRRLEQLIRGAAAFPNEGLHDARLALRDSIVAAERRTR